MSSFLKTNALDKVPSKLMDAEKGQSLLVKELSVQ